MLDFTCLMCKKNHPEDELCMTYFNEWDYILKLTEKELHSVTIIHDNADFDGANAVIRFTVACDKKYGLGVNYYGDTKLDCLRKAYEDFNNIT